jgi:hypothetical protein
MVYTISSGHSGDTWTGTLEELLERFPELSEVEREELKTLKPGEKLTRINFGFSYTISCCEEPQEESMARAIEALLDALRQRGAWPSDIDVDLVGYESYRAAHPRQDA